LNTFLNVLTFKISKLILCIYNVIESSLLSWVKNKYWSINCVSWNVIKYLQKRV